MRASAAVARLEFPLQLGAPRAFVHLSDVRPDPPDDASATPAALPLARLAAAPHGRDVTVPDSLAHVSADLTGVASGSLRDAALLGGLLIAAAGAAGLNPSGAPHVRVAPAGGVSAVLFLDPCHVSIHSLPDRGLALVDILARNAGDAAKALDVFVRRLVPAAVTSDTRMRG